MFLQVLFLLLFLASITTEYPKALSTEDVKQINDIFEAKINNYTISVENFGKEERKAIYDFLRQRYGRALVANSKGGVMEFKRLSKNSIADARDAGG